MLARGEKIKTLQGLNHFNSSKIHRRLHKKHERVCNKNCVKIGAIEEPVLFCGVLDRMFTSTIEYTYSMYCMCACIPVRRCVTLVEKTQCLQISGNAALNRFPSCQAAARSSNDKPEVCVKTGKIGMTCQG